MGSVPTVDLRGSAEPVGAAIDTACSDIGFFQSVGHDI